MTDYIDVPVAEVQIGDAVKIASGQRGITQQGTMTEGDFGYGFFDIENLAFGVAMISTRGIRWFVPRSSIVSARRKVEVVPDGEMCRADVPRPHGRYSYLCSLRKHSSGDHIAYENHAIGGREVGRAPNPPKAEESIHGPTPCYHCETCAKGCDGLVCCHCKAHKPAHTPKEPKREPGCDAYSPDASRWVCTDHENGFHVAMGRTLWPIEPPKVAPGTWRHGPKCTAGDFFQALERPEICTDPQVYRSTGWSPDTRIGQPWVLKSGDTVTFIATVGDVLNRIWSGRIESESFEAYYKRIGLDVRPIGRRAGDKGGSK